MLEKDVGQYGISVVCPTYNCSNYIQRTIDSLLNQTELPEEVIFSDDGSGDDGDDADGADAGDDADAEDGAFAVLAGDDAVAGLDGDAIDDAFAGDGEKSHFSLK